MFLPCALFVPVFMLRPIAAVEKVPSLSQRASVHSVSMEVNEDVRCTEYRWVANEPWGLRGYSLKLRSRVDPRAGYNPGCDGCLSNTRREEEQEIVSVAQPPGKCRSKDERGSRSHGWEEGWVDCGR